MIDFEHAGKAVTRVGLCMIDFEGAGAKGARQGCCQGWVDR